jgi:hypothetical protein
VEDVDAAIAVQREVGVTDPGAAVDRSRGDRTRGRHHGDAQDQGESGDEAARDSPDEQHARSLSHGRPVGIVLHSLLHRMGRDVVHIDDSWDRVRALAIQTTPEAAA